MKLKLCFVVLLVFSAFVIAGVPLVDFSEFDGHQVRLNTGDYEAGNRFTVGSSPIAVSALGFIDLDNSNVNLGTAGPNVGDGLLFSHVVNLWRVSDKVKIATATVPAGTEATLIDGFRYVSITPVILEPGAQYMISAKSGSSESYYNAGFTLTPNSEIIGDTTDWTYFYGTPSNQYPGTTFNASTFYGLANILGVNIAATSPMPEDGAEEVGVIDGDYLDVSLSWVAGADPADTAAFNPAIKKHYVFMTADQNISEDDTLVFYGEVEQNETDTAYSFIAEDLNYDGIYNWMIEEGLDDGNGGVYPAGDPNNIQGAIWTFNTIKMIPVIEENPESYLAEPGENDVPFTVVASSLSPETYQWYVSQDPTSSTPEDDAIVLNATDATLLLNNVTSADEGFYYCEVSNQSGTSVVSDTAQLMTKRLLGQWKFNDSLDDETGVYPASYPDTVIYDESGIEGGSIEFFDDPNFVTVDGTEDVLNCFEMGLTLNVWMKSTDATWSCLIGKQDRVDPDPYTGYILDLTPSGNVAFVLRGLPGITSTGVVNDGQWHMISASYDGDTGEMKLYIDAELDVSGVSLEATRPSTVPLMIGAETILGTTPDTGLIDDARVYSYAAHATEILDMYNEWIEPNKVLCVADYAAYLDVASQTSDISEEGFEPDCKIDLFDFAVLARHWMESGIHPLMP